LIAQFFDAPSMLPHLGEIERVTVEYEALPGQAPDRTQALLLTGWLAAQLGWTPRGTLEERGAGAAVEMTRRDGAVVRIELHPAAPKEDLLDRLASVTLDAARARFSITRGTRLDCAVALSQVEGRGPLGRVVRLERLEEAGLISEELRLFGRNQGFETPLRIAAALIEPR
jgi:glucose-6-phosphate dehydrogenase assembly protein OpcA